jgi:parallel beta-helix repeat protein
MTEYYVNPMATGSSDLNPGTYLPRPLKTLTKAHAIASAGDKIIVYPSIYSEQINATKSNLTWSAADENVILDGSIPFTGTWTLVSGSLYSTPYNPPVGNEPFLMIVNSVAYIFPAASSGAITFTQEPTTKLVYGAFYFDRAGNTLYVNVGGGNPNTMTIRIGFFSSVFTIQNLTNWVIDGFLFRGSNQYGIRVRGGGSHQILNNIFRRCVNSGPRLEAPTPQLFNPSDAGAGGTLTAGTKYYIITAIVGGNETLPSFEGSITIAANRKVQLQCSIVTGATNYKIYGRTQNGETLLATIAAPGSGFPTYVDDGSATSDGTTHPPTISSVQTTGNLVENNDVFQMGSHGISLYAAGSNIVRRNRSHHNHFHGIALLNYSNDNLVELNACYSNSQLNNRVANGIQCDQFGVGTSGSSRNTIQRNHCFRNQDSGISIYNGSADCIVRLNLSHDNGDHGVDNLHSMNCHMIGNLSYNHPTAGFNSEGTSQGIRMYNNISMDNGANPPAGRTTGNYRVDATANADAIVDYNLTYFSGAFGPGGGEMSWGVLIYPTLASFQLTTGQMSHGVRANPQFIDLPNRDFHLSVGSPAIHAGYGSAPDISGDDFDGMPMGTPPNLGVYS